MLSCLLGTALPQSVLVGLLKVYMMGKGKRPLSSLQFHSRLLLLLAMDTQPLTLSLSKPTELGGAAGSPFPPFPMEKKKEEEDMVTLLTASFAGLA